MTWLVTGAAGYIGSHLANRLRLDGYNLVAVDDLSSGNVERVSKIDNFYELDICDISSLQKVFKKHSITGVLHLAAKKDVAESMLNPNLYFEVNEGGTANLAKLALENNIKYFINSSSAAVYGNSIERIVSEDSSLLPISPYGQSKLHAEQQLSSIFHNRDIKHLSLRYFNVGGSESANFTDDSKSNLIPIVIQKFRNGINPTIFGDDYDTEDGTCVRDYVHISDVVNALILCVNTLTRKSVVPKALNIGSGLGYSVLEVVKLISDEFESKLKPSFSPRRIGDPDMLVANITKSSLFMDYKPKFSMREIVKSTITNS